MSCQNFQSQNFHGQKINRKPENCENRQKSPKILQKSRCQSQLFVRALSERQQMSSSSSSNRGRGGRARRQTKNRKVPDSETDSDVSSEEDNAEHENSDDEELTELVFFSVRTRACRSTRAPARFVDE